VSALAITQMFFVTLHSCLAASATQDHSWRSEGPASGQRGVKTSCSWFT